MRTHCFTVLIVLTIVTTVVGRVCADDPRTDGAPDRAVTHSALWGAHGERWSPDSRLPDFSYAGYHRGEKALPNTPTAKVSVRDYGAVGDGKTDDTEAFRRAIERAGGQAIAVPPGRYVITDFLHIERSNTVLVGASAERSVLYFPRPLEDVKQNPGFTTTGRPTSNYSWSDGYLRVRGRLANEVLATVTKPALRGATTLFVDHPERFHAGQDLRLRMQDTPDNSLAKHFYLGDAGPVDNLEGRQQATFLARVTAVHSDALSIEIDRPLRTDVELRWQPRVYAAESTVEQAGIERLSFEFPVTPYGGHFTEQGYNAIALSHVRNCWVRDVVIRNCDSGIYVTGDNITVTGLVITSDRAPDKSLRCTGHHGITLGRTDCVLMDFDIRTRFIHDITVAGGSAGNVTMSGKAVDLALDHHCYGPHANLWTDLDAGEGSRVFHSGGGADLGWHCGARTTFWNIRAKRMQHWPAITYGKGKWSCDVINIIALPSNDPPVLDVSGKWFEPADPATVRPQNLYSDQLRRRLDRAAQ